MRQDKTTPARHVGRPPKRGEAGTTRERLLQAGLEVAAAGGLRAVTVAALAERTGANAGSFVYHFGTREAYLGELVERWYAPFLAGLQQVSDQTGDPLLRLRELLTTLALWALQHGAFVAHLMADAAAGEAVARQFLADMPGRHPALILQAVADGQAAGQITREATPVTVMTFLMAAIALPPVLGAGLLQADLLPKAAARSLRGALDEAACLQRIDWALAGVAPAKA